MNLSKAPAGHFTVLYFATASSYVGKPPGGHDHLEGPLLASKLFDVLDERYPGMKEKVLSSCLLNIDNEYVDLEEEATKAGEGVVISEGSTVAIIPPVSAG